MGKIGLCCIIYLENVLPVSTTPRRSKKVNTF